MSDKRNECREILHKMRTSIGVVNGFVKSLNSDSNCDAEYLAATKSSLEKLTVAIEKMDQLVKSER